MNQSLLDPSYKAYIAFNMRQENPSLKNASDDAVISSYRKQNVPDATDQEWNEVVQQLYPVPPNPPPTTKTNDLQNFLVGGATGVGIGLAAGALTGGRVKPEEFGKVAEVPSLSTEIAPPEFTKALAGEELPATKAPTAVQAPSTVEPPPSNAVQSAMATGPDVPAESVFKPTSRSMHAFDEVTVNALRKIEQTPEYLDQLKSLGGGSPTSHEATILNATQMPAMTIEDLSNWGAGQPSSPVDVVRANFLRSYLWDNFNQALFSGDQATADGLWTTLQKIEPGYNNLTGDFGRGLEIQKVFQFSKAMTEKISELKAINAPFDQVQKEINALLEAESKNIPKDTWNHFEDAFNLIQDYATAFKLTSPITHAVNTTSNALTYLQRAMEKSVVAAELARQGNEGGALAQLKYAFGTAEGFKSAISKMSEIWSTGEGDSGFWGKARAGNKARPEVKGPAKYVFRALVAADAFWKTIIYDSEIKTKAFEQAYNEGLRGDKLGARIDELNANPPDSWKQFAADVAREYTFQQQPDKALRAIMRLQDFPGARFVIPFIATPYNIIKFYARRSIFGIASKSFWRDVAAGGSRRAAAYGRLGIGLGLSGAAMAAINTGQITGPYPKSKSEQALWLQENKRPYSIKIGNYWVGYSRIQPIGAYLMTMAAINDAYKGNNFESGYNKLGRALSSIVKGPLDLPFVQGMSAALDFVNDPEKNFKTFSQLLATGMFPNFLRDIRSQVDPTLRKPTNVKEAIEYMIPGLSQNVPPRVTILGEQKSEAPGFFARASRNMIKATETDKTKMMEQIGWAPPQASPELFIDDQKVELTGKDRTNFLTDMGKGADLIITKIMADPNFSKLTDAYKKKILGDKVELMQSRIRKAYKAKLRPTTANKGEAAVQEIEDKIASGDI